MTATGPWTRVILLTPSLDNNGRVSVSLERQFAARDWFPVQIHDPFAALTELCLRDKAQATRASWGLEPLEQLALVITHPQHWHGISELADAVERYVPHASVWVACDDDVQPFDPRRVLEAVAQHQRAASPHSALSVQSDSAHIEPTLADDHSQQIAAEVSPPSHASASNGVENRGDGSDPAADWQRITREEIDMLLKIDAEESGEAPHWRPGA